MSRVVALIDGEHYPPVVRFALGELAREHEVRRGGVSRRDREDRPRRGVRCLRRPARDRAHRRRGAVDGA